VTAEPPFITRSLRELYNHPYPFSVKLALGDSVRMSLAEHDAMHIYRKLVDDLLNRAEQIKKDAQIEPPLTEAHLGESIWAIQGEEKQMVEQLSQQTRFAAVELAFREKFYNLLV
jgi:THO complex subunit 1